MEKAMDFHDMIRSKLRGTPLERRRREELLATALAAAKQGGPQAVVAELDGRLNRLQHQLEERLAALRRRL
ncbi:MAG TPA: hypothetical protein VNK04_24330 [Gemmataceae bacterium]|jgi:hypothetical protein|nr:hypothetical protein [Gemmataceae bacterium]